MTQVQPDSEEIEDKEEPDNLLYQAWTLIANAYSGDWDSAPLEWKQAAERWRDRWHEMLKNEEEPTLEHPTLFDQDNLPDDGR